MTRSNNNNKMREFKYDIIQLIQEIRDRPCLWDQTIENYKDRIDRRLAWEEIFNKLEVRYEKMTAEQKRITGETILNKWTNVRDTFMKSLKTKMGRPKRKYVLYHHLKFLTKLRPEVNIESDQTELMEETNEETSHEMTMKQEVDSVSRGSSEISFRTESMSKNDGDDGDSNFSNSVFCIGANYSPNKKLKCKEKVTTFRTNESSSVKKKRFSIEMNDSRDSTSKTKSKSDTTKLSNDDYADNDIDFVELSEADNPRVMNEDEAFFASLLPTIVRYSEDERLEFRIEVLKVMKKIKDERKSFAD